MPISPTTQLALTTPRRLTPKLGNYEAWPDVERAADGSLLLFYMSANSHTAVGGRTAVFKRSTDQGRTWKTTATFPGSPGVQNNPESMLVLPDGQVVMLMSISTAHDVITQVRIYHSDDHGQTWDYVEDHPWTQLATIGTLIYLDNGELLACWHGDGWGMIRRTVDGVWSIESTANGGPWLMEGRMFPLEGGLIFATGRHPEGLLAYTSSDYGHTWSQGAETGMRDMSEGGIVQDNLLTLATIHRPTGRLEYRQGWLPELVEDPTAWSTPVLLTTLNGARGEDRGYPDFAELDDGSLFCVFYAGFERPSIFSAVLTSELATLRIHDRLAIRMLGFHALGSAVAVDTAPSRYVTAVNVPLFEEVGQRGDVYLRVIARVEGSRGASVRLTLGAMGPPDDITPVITLNVVVTGNGEYGADSGWVRVQDNYIAGYDGLKYSQLVLRGWVTNSGNASIMQPSTIMVGAQE